MITKMCTIFYFSQTIDFNTSSTYHKTLRINVGDNLTLSCTAGYTDGYYLYLWYKKFPEAYNLTTNSTTSLLDIYGVAGITSKQDILISYPVGKNRDLNYTLTINEFDKQATFVCIAFKYYEQAILSFDFVQLIVVPQQSSFYGLFETRMVLPPPESYSLHYFEKGDQLAFVCNYKTVLLFSTWLKIKDGKTMVADNTIKETGLNFLIFQFSSSDSNAYYYCVSNYRRIDKVEIVERKVSRYMYFVMRTSPTLTKRSMPIAINVFLHFFCLMLCYNV